MKLTGTFLTHLISNTGDNRKFEEELEKALEEMGLKIPKPDQNKPNERLWSRMERARFQRTEYLNILENYQKLFDVAVKYMQPKRYEKVRRVNEPNKKTRNIWNDFRVLLALSCSDIPVKETWWRVRAKRLGRSFVSLYGKESVTPYLHVFIYHFGFYLDRYGNLEKFGNYAIEGMHHYNKQMVRTGIGGIKKNKNGEHFHMQELKRSARELKERVEGMYSQIHFKRRNHRSWAQRTLSISSPTELDSLFMIYDEPSDVITGSGQISSPDPLFTL